MQRRWAFAATGWPSITTPAVSRVRRPRFRSASCSSDQDSACGLRRHHAPQPHAPEGRRDFSRPACPFPRSHRPRSGSRTRHRSTHGCCAARSREAVVVDEFPQQLTELTSYLDEEGPPRSGFGGMNPRHSNQRAFARALAAGLERSRRSAHRGGAPRRFAFGAPHQPGRFRACAPRVPRGLRSSARRREPWAILALAVICASDAKPKGLATSSELAMVLVLSGNS